MTKKLKMKNYKEKKTYEYPVVQTWINKKTGNIMARRKIKK